MKKILLINPPISIYVNKTAFIPLPLLILGSCLQKIQNTGLEIVQEVVDLDLMLKQGIFSDDENFYQEAGRLILDKKPDILLFTVHGLNHIAVLKLSEIVKNIRPSCFIVAGGVGPTLKAEEALEHCPNLDFIVKGEGEPVLKHLIPAILDHKNFSTVPSIVYRNNDKILSNPRVSMGKDEKIPAPNYSLVRIEEYITHNKENPYIHPGFVLIESGRGCPHACAFCAPAKMWKSTVRYRPVFEIIEEMKFLAAKGGNFSFFTQDNLEESFLKKLSESLIKSSINISWGCYSRLDRLSDDMAELLSKAGCKLIFTGFETPNRTAQKSIRKVIDPATTFKKLQHFNKNGVKFIGSFIAGFAGETDEEINNTMSFAIECATGKEFNELNPFLSGTDQDKLPKKALNICQIHPLCFMPGTDSFEKENKTLHISKYSLHPDCYGSYLFSYEEFKNDWSFLGSNPYLNHLPENKVRYYCSILRLFNFLNSRPFYFALLLSIIEKRPLELIKKMIADLGEEFVLTARIEDFEIEAKKFIDIYLDYSPAWTVKKGQ